MERSILHRRFLTGMERNLPHRRFHAGTGRSLLRLPHLRFLLMRFIAAESMFLRYIIIC